MATWLKKEENKTYFRPCLSQEKRKEFTLSPFTHAQNYPHNVEFVHTDTHKHALQLRNTTCVYDHFT